MARDLESVHHLQRSKDWVGLGVGTTMSDPSALSAIEGSCRSRLEPCRDRANIVEVGG